MANYNFNTITPEEAAAFDPATDSIFFTTLSANQIDVAFQNDTLTLFGGGRAVTLDRAGVSASDFTFVDGSQLYVGTDAANTGLTLNANNSAAFLAAGDDAISSTGTDVFIQGNQGVDTIAITADGSGTVYGGQGNDNIALSSTVGSFANGNMGNDAFTIDGTGDHTVYGGMDNDTFTVTNGGNHFLSGDLGDDRFILGGTGNSTINGGDGIDAFTVTGGTNLINGNIGDDTFSITGGENSVYGGQGGDTFNFSSSDNGFLSGDRGADTFNLASTAGDHTVFGGADADIVNIAQTGGSLYVNGNEGNDVITFDASAVGDITVQGGQGDDVINASAVTGASGFQLIGDLGNDTITGGAGNDTIDGGAGRDVLAGGGGNDLFVFTGQTNAATQGDLIQNFVVADDSVTFGSVAGSATNFATLATSGSYETALAQANAQTAAGTVHYVLVTGLEADFDNNAATPDAVGAAGSAVLFADTNGDGVIDSAVRMTGITGTFTAADIVAS